MPPPYQDLNAQDLIALVALGRKEALEELYARYSGPVYSLALHMLRSPQRAEEVAQDAFLQVWRKAATYRAERGSVSAWLMGIAHHLSVDVLRRNRNHHTLAHEDLAHVAAALVSAEPDPGDAAARNDQRRQVRELLARLPPEQRDVLFLAYFHGYSQREISQLLRQPLGTVKTRTRLALRRLREALRSTAREAEEPMP